MKDEMNNNMIVNRYFSDERSNNSDIEVDNTPKYKPILYSEKPTLQIQYHFRMNGIYLTH